MKIKELILVMLSVAVLFQIGCSCDTVTRSFGGEPSEACKDHWHWKKRAAVVQAEPESAFVPCAAPRMVSSSQGYPVRGPAGSAISIEKLTPSQVIVNEPFDYRMKITNLTDQSLLNVVVTDLEPSHMKVISSDPEMEIIGNQVRWVLGALEPKASKTISVRATALTTAVITTCANVTYEIPTCAKIEIVEPQLSLVKYAPEKSLACDRIALRYVVTNTGTGYACDISVKDILQKDMVDSKGNNEIVFAIDSLGPGESKELGVMVDAIKAGSYSSKAVAASRTGGTVESAMTTTIVSKPMLTINQSCPAKQFIGRSLTFDITVSNNGTGIAKNTVIEALVPEGIEFESSTQDGHFTHSSPGKVTWNIGSLKPNESKKVSMTLSSNEVAKLVSVAKAMAYCADTVSSTCETNLSGIPAILLEVIDISDPVELGQNETYVVTVTNQGSAVDTNIRLTCMLEKGMEFVSSSGPTTPTLIGNVISFAPLPSLAPKAKATWKIIVKAVDVGDVRFKATMNSDQLTRPVEETEATTFYK